MQPWASTALLRGLASTDPAQVPADEVVADARLTSSSKGRAVVVVPTDGGDGMVHAPRTGKTVEVVHDVLAVPSYRDRLAVIARPGPAAAHAASTDSAPAPSGG